MADEPTCLWQGASGRQYRYWCTPIRAFSGKNEAGNYILAQAGPGGWRPLYIGECESLQNRCCNLHEKWDAAVRMGATHVHSHTTAGSRQNRLDEETDLRRRFDPPLNKQ